jgi:hypothetical protein
VLLLSAVDGVADHEPVLDTRVATNGDVALPSYSLTMAPDSAEPIKVGLESLVKVPVAGLDMMGAEGAVVSCTLILKDADAVFPCVSIAEQLTIVVPIENVEPEDGEQVGVIEPSTLSVAVAVYVAIAPDGPVASIVILAGTVTTGGIVSAEGEVFDVVIVMLLVPMLLYLSYPFAINV